MKKKINMAVSFIICLTLILALPQSGSALTNRPPRTDANGNMIPDPDGFGDAERNGGLFGPLPDPFKNNPLGEAFPLWPTFGGYDNIRNHARNAIYPRDLGFGTNNSRYTPINDRSSSY